MENKYSKIKISEILLGVSILVIFILLNNIFLLSKIERERADRIHELQAQIKNLQSRISANATLIDDVK